MTNITEEEIKKIKWLTKKEVKERLIRDGYNELPSSKKKSFLQIVWDIVQEPMLILLIACGTLYFFLGDIQEAIILLLSIMFIIGLSIYQENKAERAIEALKDLSSPRALVIRDGQHIRIPGREVVKDDIIIMNEWDKVPADCLVLWSRSCSVDESLLTGESVPVRKSASEKINYEHFRPGGDDQPFVFSGTMIIQWQCIVQVLSIGLETEMGRIGKALGSIKSGKTLLQKQIKKTVTTAFIIALVLFLTVVIAYGTINQDRTQWLLSWLTLAMAMLPEEFPIVLTIFLALGAWRMSKKNVLTRDVSAVETLWAATVLCSDKTGTITRNKMTVKKLYTENIFFDVNEGEKIPKKFHTLIEYAILASQKTPFDPMEKSLINLWPHIDSESIHDFTLIQEYPLTKELLALSHIWKDKKKWYLTVASKWAPEAIIKLCHIGNKQKQEIMNQFESMAKEWLRVLWVAKASFTGKKIPTSQTELTFEFIGLIGWIDPIRETVPQAINECYRAGIRVIMITGDYPTTAQHIAKEIGLKNPEHVILGEELTNLSEEELLQKINKANILARVAPEEKLILINILKKQWHFVAMTGDGVNDAPALKSAHIGVAMGGKGTDVARESSAIVLLDDDFSSIVQGVRMGRKIFDNLKKAMTYIVSVHIPYAGMIVLPIFLWRPIILYPIHVVFMELIIDPACSIIFEWEKEEENIMSRNPRNPKESLFGRKALIFSMLQWLFVLLFVLIVHWTMIKRGQSNILANTTSFVALVIGNISLILVNRSWRHSIVYMFKIKNISLFPIIAIALLSITSIVYVPAITKIFHFSTLNIKYFLFALLAWFSSVLRFEVVKWFARKKGIELLKD